MRRRIVFKRGEIRVHNGTVEDIPRGWALCDGTNGTPDLCDHAIVGAGKAYAPMQKFGLDSRTPAKPSVSLSSITATVTKPSVTISKPTVTVNNHTLSTTQVPAHGHSKTYYTTNGTDNSGEQALSIAADYSTWTTTTDSVGGSGAHSHGTTVSTPTATVGSQTVNVNNPSVTVGNVGSVDTRQKSVAVIWIMKL